MHYTVRHITTCCNPIVHDRAPWHQALATAKFAADEAKQAGLFEVANFKAFNLSLVHILNDLKGEVSSVQGGTTTAQQAVLNALSLKPNAPDAGFVFMCGPLGTRATPEPSHGLAQPRLSPATPEPSHALPASPSRTRRHVRRTVALARPGAAPP